MASDIFNIKDVDVLRLENAMKKYPKESEIVFNQYLHETAFSKFNKSIVHLIPVSARKNVPHAKFMEPLTSYNGNLLIRIGNKREVPWLHFTNDGSGTSRKKAPLNFMSRGVDNETETVIDEMIYKLEKIEV